MYYLDSSNRIDNSKKIEEVRDAEFPLEDRQKKITS